MREGIAIYSTYATELLLVSPKARLGIPGRLP
jgi:hypothetical protein